MATSAEVETLWSLDSNYAFLELFTPNAITTNGDRTSTSYRGRYDDAINSYQTNSAWFQVDLYPDGGRVVSIAWLGKEVFKSDSSSYLGAWVCSTEGHAASVPEPSTMLLFGSGLTGVLVYRQRKLKNDAEAIS